MSALWTAAEAAAATGGAVRGDWAATGLSIDTRSLEPGDLFIALTDRRDGHDFVADALAKGAAAALVSRIPDGVSMDAPLLLAPDVQAALASGDLVELMPGYRAEPMPVSLLYPHRQHLSRRLTLFMDWLAARLAPALGRRSQAPTTRHAREQRC